MKQAERYAVMGAPISHSLSPLIHQKFAEEGGKTIIYDRIQVTSSFENQVHLFFEQGGLGLNVTAPFKEQAFQLATVKSARCQRAFAANTLWKQDGVLYADNTDGVGLCRALKQLSGARILILGAGGAARGIIPALQDEKAMVTVTNRSLDRALALRHLFENLEVMPIEALHSSFDFVINATSHGQWFEGLPDICLSKKPYCYDLTYHPSGHTPFTLWAKERGFQASDGFSMLVEQARVAFFVWHGFFPEADFTREML
jgi:shikimate dehydrogenase